jgi:hypothetical protein
LKEKSRPMKKMDFEVLDEEEWIIQELINDD